MIEKALTVEGWMTEAELVCLYAMAYMVPSGGTLVEVGSWMGRSTMSLCEAIQARANASNEVAPATLYCVDTFAGDPEIIRDGYDDRLKEDRVYRTFCENTDPYDFVRVIRSDSLTAVQQFEDNSLDWVFIDADHSYDAVMADVNAWYPKLKPNGILAGHDYGRVAVTRAIRRLFAHVSVWDKIWYVPRTMNRPLNRSLPALEVNLRRGLLKQRF